MFYGSEVLTFPAPELYAIVLMADRIWTCNVRESADCYRVDITTINKAPFPTLHKSVPFPIVVARIITDSMNGGNKA